ncbi:hypothetical protein [Mesorhizobium captivum]|uniref:hypothetical protein n=1 Tax=Mesorhizobium captivum TaxID=3072319 RepID=UPI002A247BF3|nr:hypothetical protein [Mesorhizobium sp. VK3C]MDX8447051.1 hypothetical protein [Mesorhizobium sp. VK3C]
MNGGLLSEAIAHSSYDEEREKILAEYLTALLDIQTANMRATSTNEPFGGLGSIWKIDDLIFRKKLVRFALDRRISFENRDWEYRALRAAAKEHPDLDPRKMRRGNPGKKGGGLLAFLQSSSAEREVITSIERIKELELATTGKKISTARACRIAKDMGAFPMITARRLENIVSENLTKK